MQAHGRRRWRIGRQKNLELQPDVPLKILTHFEPEEEYVLEPGDMLYLPPGWAHDGIAEGECMTYSIGFRSPERNEMTRELLLRLCDEDDDEDECATPRSHPVIYRDPKQAVTTWGDSCGFARLCTSSPAARFYSHRWPWSGRWAYLHRAQSEWWFESGRLEAGQTLVLDRRTRMMYDESTSSSTASYRASGRDAALMRRRCPHTLGHRVGAPAGCAGTAQRCEDGWIRAQP